MPPLLALLLCGACQAQGSRTEPQPVQPGPTLGAASPAAPSAATPTPAGSVIAAIEVADPTHVDLLDVYPQIKAIALRLQGDARLLEIHAFHVRRGTVDLSRDGRIVVQFRYNALDRSKPPGDEEVERPITVAIEGGTATAQLGTSAIRFRYDSGALPDPECSTITAWATAVASGVPDDSVATLHYHDNGAHSETSPVIWSLRVDGQNKLHREIDARTCAIVERRDDHVRPSPSKRVRRTDVDPW